MNNQSLAFTYKYYNIPNHPVEGRFQIRFSPIRRALMPWKDEVANTIQAIYHSADSPLFVALSGGIDSEIVARSLLENSIPFSAITIEYTNGFNAHDIQYARDFCKKHSIEHHTVTVDPNYLYTTKMEQYIDQGYCARNLYRYLQLFILETVENLNGTAVLGAETQAYYLLDGQLHIRYSTEILNTIRWCKTNNVDHCVNFFLHNPELYAAYMQMPDVQQVLNNPLACKNTVELDRTRNVPSGASPEKELVYRSVWPDLTERPKYNGFEEIIQLRIHTQDQLRARFPEVGFVYIPVNKIKTQLGI